MAHGPALPGCSSCLGRAASRSAWGLGMHEMLLHARLCSAAEQDLLIFPACWLGPAWPHPVYLCPWLNVEWHLVGAAEVWWGHCWVGALCMAQGQVQQRRMAAP